MQADSDDEDETGLDEAEKLVRRRHRAMAVSAEPIDPKTLKERMKLVPVVEKPPEVEETLLAVSGLCVTQHVQPCDVMVCPPCCADHSHLPRAEQSRRRPEDGSTASPGGTLHQAGVYALLHVVCCLSS